MSLYAACVRGWKLSDDRGRIRQLQLQFGIKSIHVRQSDIRKPQANACSWLIWIWHSRNQMISFHFTTSCSSAQYFHWGAILCLWPLDSGICRLLSARKLFQMRLSNNQHFKTWIHHHGFPSCFRRNGWRSIFEDTTSCYHSVCKNVIFSFSFFNLALSFRLLWIFHY